MSAAISSACVDFRTFHSSSLILNGLRDVLLVVLFLLLKVVGLFLGLLLSLTAGSTLGSSCTVHSFQRSLKMGAL